MLHDSCWLFPLLCRSVLVWCSPICSFWSWLPVLLVIFLKSLCLCLYHIEHFLYFVLIVWWFLDISLGPLSIHIWPLCMVKVRLTLITSASWYAIVPTAFVERSSSLPGQFSVLLSNIWWLATCKLFSGVSILLFFCVSIQVPGCFYNYHPIMCSRVWNWDHSS